MTYTLAMMEVSQATFDEIKAKMEAADYHHVFMTYKGQPSINMQGVALAAHQVEVERPNWDKYFMAIASLVATRSTCDRKHVGAVLVSSERHIISTGYNGSIAGAPHCDDVGHDMEAGRCIRTIHAEQNALIQSARHGLAIKGAQCYSTASPCWPCFRLLVQAGIWRFIYKEPYRTDTIGVETEGRIKEYCHANGHIHVEKIGESTVERMAP